MIYDVAVIGGGLAGLATAIQMAERGKRVILFEKNSYPFHRVCGEYISMESWGFLNRLGLNLDEESLPMISKLNVTSPSGKALSHKLDPGGFGISRFKLDEILAEKARSNGVELKTNFSINEVKYQQELWEISKGSQAYQARVTIGAFGKRSNLDNQQNRRHVVSNRTKVRLSNYIAVKYHVKANLPADTIELHNFDQGYCGISKVEDERYCMCYLTTANNLEKSNNDIVQMEDMVLSKNPYLKSYFNDFERLYDKPLSIAQIDFSKKEIVENNMMMIGDASGLIAPLCGNGMSMALRGSAIVAPLLDQHLEGKIDLIEMSETYRKQWKSAFNQRLVAGRMFQSLFGKPIITEGVIALLKQSPRMMNRLVRLTHGEPY